MIREQMLVIYPLYKRLEQAKQEIEREARRRRLENSTIVTVSHLRRSIQVTTDSPEFVKFLLSIKEYSITLLAA
jgi:hypothetical protein